MAQTAIIEPGSGLLMTVDFIVRDSSMNSLADAAHAADSGEQQEILSAAGVREDHFYIMSALNYIKEGCEEQHKLSHMRDKIFDEEANRFIEGINY
ncbi:hypothetical protein HYU07_03560 [Candidatus Woesearchaeota archaeon]|nr:hypothetical protein [Candidatus Woesearchaeota archaeon]